MSEPEASPEFKLPASRLPVVFGLLIFGFGIAAGFLLAFSQAGLEDSAALIVSVFLGAILVLSIIGVVLFVFRGILMRRAFGVVEAQMESFAGPLADIAQGAADRDPTGTIQAGRNLLQLSFARYAWLSARRWIIASLTGLIAAMAALAGTALLFKQNQHLEDQLRALEVQNQRISDQSALLATQVELAEAARNAEIAVEITNIAALLGEALDRKAARDAAEGAPAHENPWAGMVPVLDPVTDIDQSLRMRIVAASRAAKPYRFLEPLYRAYDDNDKIRVAMQRRTDLFGSNPGLAAAMSTGQDVAEQSLIARPASPERAQLLLTLVQSGLRDTESLSYYGLDLSFAAAEDLTFTAVSLENAMLSYAAFDRSAILEGRFGGAQLENASFASAWLRDTTFASLPGEEARGPYRAEGEVYPTFMAGTSFADAFIQRSIFDNIQAIAVQFDGATLMGARFDGAALPGATFRNAVLFDVSFDGAALNSVDFDGAYVARPDFINMLAERAAPGTFRPDRYEIDEVPMGEVAAALATRAVFSPDDLADMAGGFTAWRIRRVEDF